MDLDFLFFWGYNNYRVNNIISTNISWRKKAFFKGGIEIKKLFGNTLGLKPSQIKRIEKLYRKRIPNEKVISYDVARILCETSFEIGRQIGVLINRKGAVEYVIIGNRKQIILPDLSNYRSGEGRLKGLRLVHTHLNFEPINRDDLTDLALLRLDIVASLFPNEKGLPRLIQIAHLLPDNPAKKKWEIIGPTSIEGGIKNFTSFVQSLEEEFSRAFPKAQSMLGKERAILISVTSKPRFESEDSMEELKELAKTSGVEVVDTIIQHIKKPDPKYLMGKGKMQDIDKLKELCEAMSNASLCALGKTAANPVLTTLRYFRKEYEAHIRNKSCPAGVCSELISFSIVPSKCIGCGECSKVCPVGAITGKWKKPHKISVKKCIKCRACYETCPVKAVEIK